MVKPTTRSTSSARAVSMITGTSDTRRISCKIVKPSLRGQADVEHDQCGLSIADLGGCLLAVCGLGYLEALRNQIAAKHLPQLRLVVHYEDALTVHWINAKGARPKGRHPQLAQRDSR